MRVDIGHPQGDDLGGAQSGAIGDAERRLVFDAGRRLQQARHFFLAQHDRGLARLMHESEARDEVGASERDREEEPQRDDRAIDRSGAKPASRHMQLKPPQVFAGRRIGRTPEKSREALDVADLVLLRGRLKAAKRHVLDHALAQRADGLVDHGDAPVSREVANPTILRRRPSSRYPALKSFIPNGANPYRASGLVL